MLGTTIGNYAVTAKIGEGGMGAVYRADHAMLGRRAAVKVLLPELSTNRDIVARFFNEARALTAIRHPSIVEMFDFGYLPDGSAYIIMEYLDGESLAARCRRLRRVEVRRALMLVRQIAGALAAAHDASIVHRDLKPDNIFLVPDPEVPGGERIKVLDFGIAKLVNTGDQSKTRTGSVLGTPTYMSPEQCRGAGTVDARADFYALGCVLYEMVCGRPPFVAEGAGDLIAHHLYFPPPAPHTFDASLPEAYERLILWLLEKDPAARPRTARELVDAIDRLGVGSGNFGPEAAAALHDAPTVLVEGLLPATPLPVARASEPPPPVQRLRVPTPAQPMPLPGVAPMPRVRAPTPIQPMPVPGQTALPRLPSPTPPAPVTTLSGAAGTTPVSIAAPRRRWVIPVVAGTLVAIGVAITVLVGSRDSTPAPSASTTPPSTTPPSTTPPPSTNTTPPSTTPPTTTPASTTPPTTTPPSTTPPNTTPATTTPATTAPPTVDKVTLTIASEPAGADVFLAGAKVGKTPFNASVIPAAGKRVYTVQKSGYEPATVTLATDRAGSETVALKKKRRATPPQRGSDSVGDQGVNPFD